MTEDQRYALGQLIAAVEQEKPDAVIIAGDLYDRSVPPTDAVELLDELLERIVIELETPVLAIAGNHDSPDRLDFATRIMQGQGLYLVGQLQPELEPVVLHDEHGEVHVYLVPYADPAQVRHVLGDDSIRTHDDAMRVIIERIKAKMNPQARHIFVGHAFVTPGGVAKDNTSDAERPLAIGGVEHVHAEYFEPFHYTALGHLHQAHYVMSERIRYAGSPLKYSISEEHHQKGFIIVELDGEGNIQLDKRPLQAQRDMRRIVASISELETHEPNDDYVYVTLTDEHPVLFPMEKVRAVYPNALHVERQVSQLVPGTGGASETARIRDKRQADPAELFAAFYQEVTGQVLGDELRQMFADTYDEILREEGERA